MLKNIILASAMSLATLVGSSAVAQDKVEDADAMMTPAFIFTEAPGDHTLGKADAEDTLIVYASNMCPHCGDWFNNEWPTVKADLVMTGKLRFVFRPMPTPPMQMALTGFVVAECAPEEDYFTVMEDQFARQRDLLSAAQAQDSASVRAQFDAIAKGAGLADEDAIAACLGNEQNLKPVQTSAERFQTAKMRGVPAFVFNGEVMEGDHNAEDIAAWVSAD